LLFRAFLLSKFSTDSLVPASSAHRFRKVAGLTIDLMTSESLFTNPIVEELIDTVAFYGIAEIPADLLACLKEIAADLAQDDGTVWWVPPTSPDLPTRLAA
jgi:hypothetical protein